MSYVEKVKPIISTLLNGEIILIVEGEDNEICKLLDITCGTDYFQVYLDTGLVWGVASRIQKVTPGFLPFNTFTMRKSKMPGIFAEYEKKETCD